ncbi:ligase-associated DNA damage response endonuclease PdeM [Psychroflexus aestuariivivens]|uniref:ligase-associated DNA damage response endonuclease PdeM n=1 Tax=Psychroflexus aestuariivivens TaxID=1795040 RepID=UPI000FDC9A0F|nr:ligase-associated DNA damage response endonuclease PdeM [Psychroflexus aestuariivivens]
MKIEIQNDEFILDPSGALYWTSKNVLLIADLHLGKIHHFRKHGHPIPAIVSLQNFLKLERVISKFKPKKVIFLGDLFHSTMNKDWHKFQNWIEQRSENFTLVVGNHDILAPEEFEKIDISLEQNIETEKFLLTHHPTETEDKFNICGHLHPGFRLNGEGKQQMKLACFFRSQNQLILPAFGTFTGKALMLPEPEDQVYVVADNEVFPVF